MLTSGPGSGLTNLAISADGKKILYSAIRISSNLWSVSWSPTSSDTVSPPAPFTEDTSQRNNLVRFSPDGRRVALTRWRPGTSADIWVADADGKNLTLNLPITRQLIARPVGYPRAINSPFYQTAINT